MRLLRERPRPFVYAVLVHLLLLAVLIFSLDWAPSVKPTAASKPAPVQAVVVDAAQLDNEVKRQKQLEEQKQREAQEKLKRMEEQAKAAEQKRQQEEQRAAELKRQREEQTRKQAEEKRKAEVAARQKAEAEKQRKAEEAEKQRKAAAEKQRQEEAKRKAEAEKKRQQEEAKRKAEAEKKRQEEAKRKAEAERKRQEDEARKAAEQEMQARLAAEQERMATQRRSAMQRMIDEYVLYIQEKVQRSWIRPPSSGAELSCTVEVRLIPSGEVIDAQIVRSSGNTAFDRSVEAAVFKASPLPVPPDPEVMEQFRSLRFEFKPGSA
jgi:colicin import membrane protein